MLKLPQSIIYAIVAFNITSFTLLLQLDLLFFNATVEKVIAWVLTCLLYTSPSPRDGLLSRMPSSA